MAKHAKKNNIISYDEAKHKKLQEKEEQKKIAAKHFRDDYEEYEDIYGNSFSNDVQITNEYSNREDYNRFQRKSINKINEDDETYEDENTKSAFDRRERYNQEKQPIPRNLVNLIVISSMVVFLIIITIMLYNYYVVKSINVIGNESVKYHDVTQLCGVEYKQSMLSIKKEDIEESFESQQPMIEVVEVKKIWPNVLEIHIKERPPICYIVLKGSQKCALIGENNVCLSIVDSYLEDDMPRIYGLDVGTGELGKEIVDGEIRKLEVLKLIISAMVETNCISELESININNTTNIIMTSTTGTEIKIGDVSNLTIKFNNTKIGIQRLISENNTNVTMVVTGDNSFYIE